MNNIPQTTPGRIGEWMMVRKGGRFHPLDPDPSSIHIEDIALSLSRIARWQGFTDGEHAMNVAHHSVLVSIHCDPEYALHGLLHDAAEAYMGDMIRPMKNDPLMKNFRVYESSLMSRIFIRYGLDHHMPKCIKEMDDIVMATEVRDLIPWVDPEYAKKISGIPTLHQKIVPMSPRESEKAFLSRFRQIYREN